MALNIKSASVERKARLLAQHTGQSITRSIERAIDNELRLMLPGGNGERLKRWEARLAAHGVEPTTESWDWKSDMYDEFGLPR